MKSIITTIKNNGSPSNLVWKFPVEDFNTNSVLIVNPSEEAIFVNNGNIVNVFSNGRYELKTENYPFLSAIRNVLSNGVSTFHCLVYFVNLSHSKEVYWGTDSPIQLRDPVQKIATSIRARGSYKVSVVNSTLLLTKMLGVGILAFREQEINAFFINQFQQQIKSTIAKNLSNCNEELLGICLKLEMLANIISPEIHKILFDYGLKLEYFAISGMDIPENDPNRKLLEQAYAKSREVEIMGDKYKKIKTVDIATNLSKNEGTGTGTGAGVGAAVGLAMFQKMSNLNGEKGNIEEHLFGGESTPEVSVQDKLQELKQLLEQNLIEENDYNEIKKEVLKKYFV